MNFVHKTRACVADSRGAAALEFALVVPILLLLLLGMMAWGGYFWMSHCVQQIANDSARAAIGGLTAPERLALAQSTLRAEVATYGLLNPNLARVTVLESGSTMSVAVIYDAAETPFFALKGLVPMPSSTISRQAATRLGGL